MGLLFFFSAHFADDGGFMAALDASSAFLNSKKSRPAHPHKAKAKAPAPSSKVNATCTFTMLLFVYKKKNSKILLKKT